MERNSKIIYFIYSSVPTEEEKDNLKKLVGKAVFRNALFVHDDDRPELCDYVYGEKIPDNYKDFAVIDLDGNVVTPAKVAETVEPTTVDSTKVAWKPGV